MAIPTTSAQQRFLIYTQAIKSILAREHRQKDKGLAFYRAGARDVIFRLEGLCRLYREVHNVKFFDTWYKTFKQLEDRMGRMDYLESMAKEFSQYKELKTAVEREITPRLEAETKALGKELVEAHWLSGEKIHDLEERLGKIKWESEAEDRNSFAAVFVSEFDKLTDRYANGEIDPSKLEDGLHEFRRRLRWGGIYSQVANGLFQLQPVGHIPAGLKKYITREIVQSPFNQLPKTPKGIKPVVLQAPYYYSMSWTIQYLGELKDCALRFRAFTDLCHKAKKTDKALEKRFLATCKYDPANVPALAEEAIDAFIYSDFIPERIARDVMRSMAVK